MFGLITAHEMEIGRNWYMGTHYGKDGCYESWDGLDNDVKWRTIIAAYREIVYSQRAREIMIFQNAPKP